MQPPSIHQIPSMQIPKQNSGLHLKPGQIFFGSVQKIFPNQTARVQAGSQTLIAKLEVPIESGKGYWFKTSLKDGEVFLQLMPKDAGSNSQRNILNQLSLPQDKVSKQLVSFLQKEQIPFSKEEILAAAALLKEVPDLSKGLKTLRLMAEKDFPLSKGIFHSLIKMDSPEKIHSLMDIIQQNISKEAPGSTVNSLLSIIKSIKNPQESADFTLLAAALKEKIKDLTGTGRKAAENLLAKLEDISNENVSVKGNKTMGFNTVKQAIKETLEIMDPLSSEEKQILSDIQQNIQTEQKGRPAFSLKETLLNMGLFYEANLEAIKRGEEDLKLKPLLIKYLEETGHPEKTRETVDLLLSKMNGQQLLSSSTGPIQDIFYQIPFQMQNFKTDITMHWSGKRKENGQLDTDFCRILFYLDLKHIKETVVDMKVQNRVVSVNIINPSAEAAELSPALTPILKKQLESLDYTLSSVSFKPPLKDTFDGIDSNWTTGQAGYTGLDVKI